MLERKKLVREVIVGTIVLAGVRGVIDHLVNGARLAEAAEPLRKDAVEVDQAFSDHVLEAKYSGFQLVDQAVGARREVESLSADECVDSDWDPVIGGINIWKIGTTTVGTLSVTDFCFCDWSCFLGYTKPYLVEYSCSRKDRASADFIICEEYNAFCQIGYGRCVPKEEPTPVPTPEPTPVRREGLVTITGKDESLAGAKLVPCSPDLKVCWRDEDHPLAIVGKEGGDWGIYGADPGEWGMRICDLEVEFCSDEITRKEPHWWGVGLRPVEEQRPKKTPRAR